MTAIMYLGTDSGVHTLKNDNGYDRRIAAHGVKDWEISELAVAPGAPIQVFAATRGDGVWVSKDFGKT